MSAPHTNNSDTQEISSGSAQVRDSGADNAPETGGRMKGILFILLAAFFFSLMSVFVRLSGDVPTMQKAFFRNIVAAIVAAVLLMRSSGGSSARGGSSAPASDSSSSPASGGSTAPARIESLLPKSSLPALFMRSLFGTAGILANFWAVDHLGIADANMLNKLSPFFAILMSIPILKERPNRIEWLSVLLAFTGAAFVAKPSTGIVSLPALIGIFGGFAAGTAYTFVRRLGLAGVRGPVIVMFFSAFSTLVLLPNLLLHYHPMTARQLVFLLLAGVSAAGGQLSITAAYSHAPARDISVFDYSQVLYAALLGLLIFGELPDRWSLLGYAIIIGTAFWKWHMMRAGAKN